MLATHRRRISAPNLLETSCGRMVLPSDLLIFRPFSSTSETVGQQGLVGRMSVDRATGQQRGMEPAAMLVGALEVRSARGPSGWPSGCEPRSTCQWVVPESNQTSRVSLILS